MQLELSSVEDSSVCARISENDDLGYIISMGVSLVFIHRYKLYLKNKKFYPIAIFM